MCHTFLLLINFVNNSNNSNDELREKITHHRYALSLFTRNLPQQRKLKEQPKHQVAQNSMVPQTYTDQCDHSGRPEGLRPHGSVLTGTHTH
jgi:hypothetical protein